MLARQAIVFLCLSLLVGGCGSEEGLPIDGAVVHYDGGVATDLWQLPDVSDDAACNTCHGSAENAAPPSSLLGLSSSSERAVGAHQSHLKRSDWRAPIACDACHRMPATIDATGHIDDGLPAEVLFSPLAKTAGAQPLWDGVTCGQTYCHGATLDGGAHRSPSWTTVDGSQTTCSSCHGMPPGGSHPQVSACAGCHGDVVDSALRFIAPERHIDGRVDVKGGSACNSCHGSADNAAPPIDTQGNSDATNRGVGAHQAHVRDTTLHAAYACSECHVTPASVGATGHMDPSPAEVVFGEVARGMRYRNALSLTPTWNAGGQLRCASTYCHAFDGAVVPTPQWNGSDKAACGTCHGMPPTTLRSGGSHPQGAIGPCSGCHPSVNGMLQIIDITLHADGKVDLSGGAGCSACHGSAQNAAPPKDTQGQTDTSARGVGVHQSHVQDTALHDGYACGVCHVVPSQISSPGHIDSAPAEVTFGAIVTGALHVPSLTLAATWNAQSDLRCRSTYCHNFSGAKVPTPKWTSPQVLDCEGCHGLPPTGLRSGFGNHLPATRIQCVMCHLGVDDQLNITDPSLHANGTIDINPDQPCCECHGDYC